ncbi:MAG: hypothetical protein ACKVQJ_03675 [Pyrinomonadaceae bacterium]
MRKTINFLAIILMLIGSSNLSSQTYLDTTQNHKIKIEPKGKYPDLDFNFDEGGKLKIATRKTKYSIGETLILDVAILNRTNSPSYYPVTVASNLRAESRQGKEVLVNAYSSSDGEKPFVLVGEGRIKMIQLQLVLGCSDDIFSIRDDLLKAKNDAEVFNKGLFVLSGNACLGVKRGNNIRLTIELDNEDVVVTGESKNPKTATGRLRSNSLDVTIN